MTLPSASRLLALVGLLGLFGLVGALSGCRKPSAREGEGAPSQVTLLGVKLETFRGSALAGTGRAVKVTYQRSLGTYQAQEAVVRFPSRAAPGERGVAGAAVEVRAGTLRGAASSPTVEAEGGVVARTGQGVVAQTPKARFDGQAMVATGSDGVLVTAPSYRLSAPSFVFRFADEEYDFTQDVRTEVGIGGAR